MVLSSLALSIALLAPQSPEVADPRLSSVLSKSEQEKLNSLAKKWFQLWREHRAETNSRKRLKIRKSLDKARERFMKEWRSKDKKQPIKHPGDLLAVFRQVVFTYKRKRATGKMKKVSSPSGRDYWVAAPKSYDEDEAYPTVVMLPERKANAWGDATEAFDKTWAGTKFVEKAIVVVPVIDDGIDLDPFPDMSTDNGDAQEMANNGAFFGPIGQARDDYSIDQGRLILDCGKGTCNFGLRVATHFPTRFAGIILRHPTDPGKLRLESLTGIPVLLISNQESKDAAEQIANRLNGFEKGSCTVVEAKDAHPHPGSSERIAKWAQDVRRDMFRKRVVVAPNQDRWLRSYWVEVLAADSVFTTSGDDRPYVEAVADRDANRITVTARGISTLRLLLNDAMVDLDKEFTVVINGKALTERRERSLFQLTELIFYKEDPDYIFVANYATAVPKTEGSPPDEGEK